MLDFAKLFPQIRALAANHIESLPSTSRSVSRALHALLQSTDDWEEIARKVRTRTDWHLMAIPVREPLATAVPLPDRPEEYTALAVDGSQIAADRHEIAHCILLNVGRVALHYGVEKRPLLSSVPQLCYVDAELYEELDGEVNPISARRLATRRLQAECLSISRLIEEQEGDAPLIALVDGTLILWALEAETAEVRHEVLQDFIGLLEAAREREALIAGYISGPGSRDVVNLLRAWICGLEEARCGLTCTSMNGLRVGSKCEEMTEITDRALFASHLKRGERSAVFGSRSRILKSLPDYHQIGFFYLNTGSEIARVEAPMWVLEEDDLLTMIHSLTYDQAVKGAGYPRALTEAHECAVVRGQDRALMYRLIEKELIRSHVPVEITRKALSKRTRSV